MSEANTHDVMQAALQNTEAQLLHVQRENEAQAQQLEAQTQELQMLQELSAEQQAAQASISKQSEEREQRLTLDVATLQVIFALCGYDHVVQNLPCTVAHASG